VRVSSTGDEKKIAQAHEGHGSIGEKIFIFLYFYIFIFLYFYIFIFLYFYIFIFF